MKVFLRTGEYPDGVYGDADILAGTVRLPDGEAQVDSLRFLPPTTGRVYGVLFNYQSALEEAGRTVDLTAPPYGGLPDEAVFTMKLPNTVAAHGSVITIPYDAGSDVIAVEASLGVVIGSYASRLTENNAMNCVAGYTIVCDAAIPHTNYYRPPIRYRCRDGFCPLGPWVADKTAVPRPESLGLRVFVDGKLECSSNTDDWIRSIPQLLCELTDFFSLCPGDVVLTGSPAGAPKAGPGQCVRIEIDGIGALETTVAMEKGGAA